MLVYNVKDFGAVGDGVADDTAAIQRVIDVLGEIGGGTVYLPRGTYKVMPQTAYPDLPATPPDDAVAALTIKTNNISIVGDGKALTKLLFRTYGDLEPTTDWELADWSTDYPGPQVYRGHGFYMYGDLENILLKDFEYDGNCYPGNTGDKVFPANTTTGDGWDITHKCMYMFPLNSIRDLHIESVSFHNWRGELIYRGGGGDAGDMYLSDSDIFETNADGVSITLGLYADNNRIYNCLHAASESFHVEMPMVWRNNYFVDCDNGINFQTNYDTESECLIRDNTFVRCGTGILANIEAGPLLIDGNQFIDCNPTENSNLGDISLSPGDSFTGNSIITGITITNNKCIKQATGGGYGILLGCQDDTNTISSDPYELSHIEVAYNFIESSREALAANKRYLMPIYLSMGVAPAAQTVNITIHDNTFLNTQRDIQNVVKNLTNLSPMPLMWNNNCIGKTDAANNYVQTDGSAITLLDNSGVGSAIDPQVLSGVQIVESTVNNAFYIPVLDSSNFRQGQHLIFTSGSTPGMGVYFPPSWAGYQCTQGRYIYGGTYLVLRFEAGANQFIEQRFIDDRNNHYNQVTSGTDLAFLGFENLILTPSTATTYTSFSGIGHMAMARVTASNGNVTIQNGGSIQLAGGANLTMAANQTILLYYNTSNVLVQIS